MKRGIIHFIIYFVLLKTLLHKPLLFKYDKMHEPAIATS